jgi:hypothetical protein
MRCGCSSSGATGTSRGPERDLHPALPPALAQNIGTPAGPGRNRSWSGYSLAGCWYSYWHSTGQYQADSAPLAGQRTPPDLVERDSTAPPGPVGMAYGSEGWGFESLRAR